MHGIASTLYLRSWSACVSYVLYRQTSVSNHGDTEICGSR